MHRFRIFVGMMMLGIMVIVLTGCVANQSMQRTEEGYAPTHVTVGKITPKTYGDSRMSPDDVSRMVETNMENFMNREALKYITMKGMGTTPIDSSKIIKIDASIRFQEGVRGGEEVIVMWELRRLSDNLLFDKGSSRSTDVTISQGATTDLRTGIINASHATILKVKEKM